MNTLLSVLLLVSLAFGLYYTPKKHAGKVSIALFIIVALVVTGKLLKKDSPQQLI